jgi:hypothetical protein
MNAAGVEAQVMWFRTAEAAAAEAKAAAADPAEAGFCSHLFCAYLILYVCHFALAFLQVG